MNNKKIITFSSHLLILLYSLYLGNIIIWLVYILFYVVTILLFNIVISQNEDSQTNKEYLRKILSYSILFISFIAILVDIDRTYVFIEKGRALQSVGNERSFYYASVQVAKIYKSGLGFFYAARYFIENPLYTIITSFFQYVSLVIAGKNTFFINVIPNIFMGSLTNIILLDSFLKKAKAQIISKNFLLLFILNPMILSYSIVGMRDMIVVLFTIIPIYIIIIKNNYRSHLFLLLFSFILVFLTRVVSLLYLIEFIVLYLFFKKFEFKKSTVIIFIIVIISSYFILENTLVKYSSEVFSNNYSLLINKYKSFSLGQSSNSLTYRLNNLGIPGIPFIVYLLTPLFVVVFTFNDFFSLILGLGGVYWDIFAIFTIIILIKNKLARRFFLTTNDFWLTVIIMIQVFSLSAEYRHKLPFMLWFILDSLVMVYHLKLNIDFSNFVKRFLSALPALFIIYLLLK